MPLKDWVKPVADIASQAFNAIFQGGQNRKMRRWNEKMYRWQRADNIADRDYANWYNSPAQEMARLRAAGLAPTLAYENGATHTPSAVTRGADAGAWNPQAPTVDLGSALGSIYDLSLKDAQLDNLNAQNAVFKQDAILRAAQVAATVAGTESTKAGTTKTEAETHNVRAMLQKIIADTKSTETGTALGQVDLATRSELNKISIDALKASVKKTQAETTNTLSRTQTENVMRQPNLNKAVAEYYRILAERGNIHASRWEIRERTKNLEKDGTLKQLDIEMRRAGLQPGDPFYYRIIQRIGEELRKGRGNLEEWLKNPTNLR